MGVLYIIVPCYNEEEVLPSSAPILRERLAALISSGKADEGSRLVFVDDGSADATWDIISRLCAGDGHVCGLRLGKNRGHQNAVMAGLARTLELADATVTIDADLQDSPEAIDEMADKFNAGCPIVCGVRRSRESDSFLKRVTARGFYLLAKLGGAKVIYDHADFRLLSREAVERLLCFGTEDLFIRGLITRLGLPTQRVYYDRSPRMAGESKYTMRKMLHLARRGFQSGRATPAAEPCPGELYIAQEIMQ